MTHTNESPEFPGRFNRLFETWLGVTWIRYAQGQVFSYETPV